METSKILGVALDELDKTAGLAGIFKPNMAIPAHPKEWIIPFLVSLRVTGNVTASAMAANINRATVFKLKRENPDFAEAMLEAIEESVELLEMEARRRAMNSSDDLMKFLLRAARPSVYTQGALAQANAAAGNVVVKTYVGWSPDNWDDDGDPSADDVQADTVAIAAPEGQIAGDSSDRVSGWRQEQMRGGEGSRLLQEIPRGDGPDAPQGPPVDDKLDGIVL